MKKFSLLALVALLFLVSCNVEESSQKVAKTTNMSTENAESNLKLLFFMNPNGRPCQIQDQELTGGKLANIPVEYIKTTVRTDRNRFYDFGVRSLPQLILVDRDNNIKKRFTPGIQQVATINKAVSQLQ